MKNNRMEKGDKKCEPWVYVLSKGRSLDDEDREKHGEEITSAMAKFGVVYQRDADAGVLPGNTEDLQVSAVLIDRKYRSYPEMGDCRSEEEGVVNVFKYGRLKYPEKFSIQGVGDVLEDITKYWDARLSYVVLVADSPLHRHIHREHACIPSNVLALFNNKVLVESCLVDRETLEIKFQPNEPAGKLFIMDRPEPARPGYVRAREWESRPVIAAIPDGSNGVGGRTLIRTSALERDGYHGGDHPHDIKDISPETLGFVEEKSPNSLPMLVMANKIRVISATGGGRDGGFILNLILENQTDEEITIDVPAGSLFEVIDPKAAVQNLATASGISIKMGPRTSRGTMINAYCANHHFAGPKNQPMRPTIFKMKNPGRSQDEVWNDLDNRGY
ncbi:MAG: hypothetical protein Q7J68_03850 [Thermoplasmata archaeon]|nr:hypothetical protein [Thermoplasmata archaeon]